MAKEKRTESEVAADFKGMLKELPMAWRDWHAARDFAFSPGASGDGQPGGQIAYSDPAGEVAITKQDARGTLASAERDLADAYSKIRQARAKFHRLHFPKDHRTGYEPVVVMAHTRDSVMSGTEKDETLAARQRRQARGEM